MSDPNTKMAPPPPSSPPSSPSNISPSSTSTTMTVTPSPLLSLSLSSSSFSFSSLILSGRDKDISLDIPLPSSYYSQHLFSQFLSPALLHSTNLPRLNCDEANMSFLCSQDNSSSSSSSVISPPFPPSLQTDNPSSPSSIPPPQPSPSSSSPSSRTSFVPKSIYETLVYSKNQALKGGVAGASAQVFNVLALMWLRTTMNYQYRYGGRTTSTIAKLWREGGVPRFYRGILPALMQSPLSRFGDTAANVGVLAFLDSSDSTKDLPVGLKTAVASSGAATWRFFLMPLDAWKTIKQVEGGEGLKALRQKVSTHGFPKLYHGSLAAMSATFVGHYPWFLTHNYLSQTLPLFDFFGGKYVRNAGIGFCASVISDTCSNSIRVIKTTKQTSTVPLSYTQTVKEVVTKDGVLGLFGRGLGTRILTNGMQGMVFSVGWKTIQEFLEK